MENKFVVLKSGKGIKNQTLRTSDSLSEAKKFIETEIINKITDGCWVKPEFEGCEHYTHISDNSEITEIEILQEIPVY